MLLLHRYYGALVGVLAGDALGAPYENQKAAVIREDFARRGGLVPFDYLDPWEKVRQVKMGQPTDDSELAACLGLSLGERPMFDAEDLYHRLRSFIHGRQSVLTDGPAYGTGGTLRAALKPESYAHSRIAFENGDVPVVPSNGSLMRCAPVALRCYDNVDQTIDFAARQSRITHVHPVAQATCVAYSVLLSKLLAGEKPAQAWSKTQTVLWDHQYATEENGYMRYVLKFEPLQPTEEQVWPKTGSAMLSFTVALWALCSSGDFREGITKAISLGGDTDTYAAIAGGLLGAHHGTYGIPHEWYEVLIGREKMESIAIRLYELAQR